MHLTVLELPGDLALDIFSICELHIVVESAMVYFHRSNAEVLPFSLEIELDTDLQHCNLAKQMKNMDRWINEQTSMQVDMQTNAYLIHTVGQVRNSLMVGKKLLLNIQRSSLLT